MQPTLQYVAGIAGIACALLLVSFGGTHLLHIRRTYQSLQTQGLPSYLVIPVAGILGLAEIALGTYLLWSLFGTSDTIHASIALLLVGLLSSLYLLYLGRLLASRGDSMCACGFLEVRTSSWVVARVAWIGVAAMFAFVVQQRSAESLIALRWTSEMATALIMAVTIALIVAILPAAMDDPAPRGAGVTRT